MTRRSPLRALAALLATTALGAALAGGPPAAAADPGPSATAATGATAAARESGVGPRLTSFPAALLLSNLLPDLDPPGANDWTCRPSAAHPRPVVLVHGTVENRYDNWAQMAPDLAAAGYCVFALDYGSYTRTPYRGLSDIAASAQELSAYVDRVLAATGAAEVDLVGHSQGGMMPRYYLRFLGGADEVDQLIGLSSSNYGTTFFGVLPLVAALPGGEGLVGLAAPAIPQQRQGSDFLARLNQGGDTVPGVRYTVIQTLFDNVVTPYRNAFLKDPGVTNILLQSRCPLDQSDHLSISYSPNVVRLVKNRLDPSTARSLCVYSPPLL
ncbi:triacylglycerol lipase [Nocardioides sp. P86]|uniref:esterase/lipase family protein n=1 Tax=Nocardioides sp. P86 TaxID=2939569 RepID=UPI00203F2E89|nr:alpha/beta fold hydrolase [Nocardioides sp. P86]MCM3514292.1 alpha/beta fold hydrolase [Nocardioides sp. P86]